MSKTIIIDEKGTKLYILDHKGNKTSNYFLAQHEQKLRRHERYREPDATGVAHVTFYTSHDARLVFLFRYFEEDDIGPELGDKLHIIYIVNGQPIILPKDGEIYTVLHVNQEIVLGEEFGIIKTTKLTLDLTTGNVLGQLCEGGYCEQRVRS